MDICAFTKLRSLPGASARFRRHQPYEHREKETEVGWDLTCLSAFRQRLPPRLFRYGSNSMGASKTIILFLLERGDPTGCIRRSCTKRLSFSFALLYRCCMRPPHFTLSLSDLLQIKRGNLTYPIHSCLMPMPIPFAVIMHDEASPQTPCSYTRCLISTVRHIYPDAYLGSSQPGSSQNFQSTPSLVLSAFTVCVFTAKLGISVVRLYRGIRSVRSILEAGLCSMLFVASVLLLIFSILSNEKAPEVLLSLIGRLIIIYQVSYSTLLKQLY